MLDRDSNSSVNHPSEQADREALVSTVHINDIIRMLRRHVWLVLALAAVTVGPAWYFTWRAGPAYRAVAVIRLSDPRRALTGGVVDDPARADERFSDPLLSQIELMSSRTVAGAVVDSMPILRLVAEGFPDSLLSDVAMTPTAMPRTFLLSFAADSFTLLDSGAATRVPYGTAVGSDKVRFTFGAAPERRQGKLQVLSREVAISRLLARLRVRPRTRTDVVDVAYTAPDPQRAQQVVNRAVDIVRTTSAQAAQQQSRKRREFLETQLRINDSLLADARQALTAFHRRARDFGSREAVREQSQGIEPPRQMEAERRTYEDLLGSLNDSSSRRRALQTAFSVPGVASSPAVSQLNNQLFQYETARDSLESRSLSHPDLPRLRQLIASTEDRLLRAVQVGVQSSIAALDARIAAVNDMRARQEEESSTEAEDARLTERVDNARKMSDELRMEYQKSGIAEAVTVGQVEVVDRASRPLRPVGIGLGERLALGLLVGLLLGAGGAFLAERLTSSIGRRAQVEQLGMPVLGVVPRCQGHSNGSGGASLHAVIESLRGIRLNLINASHGTRPIVVTITSPGSGDGKSLVSSNLALAFAHANHRTLLIDADLRRGTLHRQFEVARRPGLTDYLVGDATAEQAVQSTKYPSLDFLPGGSRRADAPELISSPRMADLLASMRDRYAIIVIDTPPLGAGVDAIALATLAGTMLMVLRLGRTSRELARAQLEILRRLPPRLLGAILNDVREESEYRAYAYYMDGYQVSGEPPFQPLVGARSGAESDVAG